MKKFCEVPFMDLRSFSTGRYGVCCAVDDYLVPDENITDENPMTYFQSPFMNKLRYDMIKSPYSPYGSVKEICKQCIDLEDAGLHSIREPSEWYNRESTEELWINRDTGELNFDKKMGRSLKIKLNFYGNQCNLECYMCEPWSSTKRMEVYKKLPKKFHQAQTHYDNYHGVLIKYYPEDAFKDICYVTEDRFEEISENLLKYSHLISMVEVLGGEPALMKRHLNFLQRLVDSGDAKDILLSYISNMTILSEEWISIIKEFKRKEVWNDKMIVKGITLQWSCDDIEERSDWIRYPSNWDSMVDNVKKFKEIFPDALVKVTNTPSILSVLNVDKFYEKMKFIGFDGDEDVVFNNVLLFPDYLQMKHLPNTIKEKLNDRLKGTELEFLLYYVNQERNEEEFKLCIDYLYELDRIRGTNWTTIFPELAQ